MLKKATLSAAQVVRYSSSVATLQFTLLQGKEAGTKERPERDTDRAKREKRLNAVKELVVKHYKQKLQMQYKYNRCTCIS